MAKCTRSIATEGERDYSDYEGMCERSKALRAEMKENWRAARPGEETVGEIIRFQIADGYAEYMVRSERPLEIVHLDDGDAWKISPAHIRGLRLGDVRDLVARDAALKELFAQRRG